MTQLIIIGFGGHARVIEDCVASNNKYNIVGYMDMKDHRVNCDYLGTDKNLNEVKKIYPNASYVVGVGDMQLRRKLIAYYESENVVFATVIHSSAIVSPSASVERGTVIFPQAVVNAGAMIGAHCILNTGAIVEHDNQLESNVHMAPRAAAGGHVSIGHDTMIGLGASIINNISIGSNCVIGSGSVVTKNITKGSIVYGVPAKLRR